MGLELEEADVKLEPVLDVSSSNITTQFKDTAAIRILLASSLLCATLSRRIFYCSGVRTHFALLCGGQRPCVHLSSHVFRSTNVLLPSQGM